MSLFGAMFSGVSGLNAEAQSLGMISDNISNVNTIGYKTSSAAFSTLVTRQTVNYYAPGGVRSQPVAHVDRQGLLQPSANATDLAVSGNGFFVVAANDAPTANDRRFYTRAGEFAADSTGYLKSPSGYFLQGWRTDATGTPLAADTSTLTNLETIRVTSVSGNATPTSNLELGINLPASQASSFTFTQLDAQTGGPASDGISAIYFGATPTGSAFRYSYDSATESLTLENLTAGTSQTVSVAAAIDAVAGAGNDLGAGETAVISFSGGITMTLSGTAGFTRGADIPVGTLNTAGLAVGTTMTAGAVTLPAGGINRATIAALVAAGAYNAATGLLTLPVASSGAAEAHFNPAAGIKFSVDGGAVAANIAGTDLDDGAAHAIGIYVNDGVSDVLVGTVDFTALASTGAGAGSITLDLGTGLVGETSVAAGGSQVSYTQIYDSLGVAHTMTLTWSKTAANAWTLVATVPGAATIDEGAVGAGTGYSIDVVFNGDGTPATFDGAATPPALAIGGWTSGANDSIINLDLGTQNVADGVTQFSSSYSVAFINQNGVQFGSFFGVRVDEDGVVTALYDNGQTLKIYKVPVATFANPNGLEAQNGTVYSQSERSGVFVLRAPGTNGAGKIVPSSLEASTTDLAAEFTTMIIAQRAYSASAKTITTADEMLDELIHIKR